MKAFVVEGTYESGPLFEGVGDPSNASQGTIHESGETTSQAYLTCLATRVVIFIEATNPTIGLMAFIGVGMAEVSTCDIIVKVGQEVSKGDEIGMFHFSGSTLCLLFRAGMDVQGLPVSGGEANVPVRSHLANVS